MTKLIAAAFGAAIALTAHAAAAQDAPQITLPEGAQLLELPGGACGLYGIVVMADGSQQVITAEGEVRPVGEEDVTCLTQLVTN
ncbi:hypothetical protein [Pseudoroseicyclus tamaricis]|uniref:Uncharacterized protein n=1 Tax=Pseudoroseicyclus tamaricis TaxID=2705421 RepID=A0A6B2JW63_9RHOB|nr:hypothetical protein [Pseudoroseicyclus tamaricis]NDV00889.1 hypothetical protein [Pseudoroseicyclus tamaricis]